MPALFCVPSKGIKYFPIWLGTKIYFQKCRCIELFGVFLLKRDFDSRGPVSGLRVECCWFRRALRPACADIAPLVRRSSAYPFAPRGVWHFDNFRGFFINRKFLKGFCLRRPLFFERKEGKRTCLACGWNCCRFRRALRPAAR